MKTQAECYQALLDGKILYCYTCGFVKLINGAAVGSKDLIDWIEVKFSFSTPKDWSIYEEKPKYEVLYECLGEVGHIRYCFESKEVPDFDEKRKLLLIEELALIKNGNKLLLNMETWEVCEYDEGLL